MYFFHGFMAGFLTGVSCFMCNVYDTEIPKDKEINTVTGVYCGVVAGFGCLIALAIRVFA